MKKVFTGIAAAAAMLALGAAAVSAAGTEKVDVQGITFQIPEEVRELVTVETEGLEEGTLVRVSETASIDAAAANGEDIEGPGWLFSIGCITEERAEEIRCGGMEGLEIFAEDDDHYYVYCHPTDVRFVREQYENIDEDMAEWSMLNEWANQTVRGEILANNKELEEKKYSNTSLDMFLCSIAFQGRSDFEIRSLEFRELDPSALDDDEFIEDLTEDVVYEPVYDEEAPDGEYIILEFPEEKVRFDFFSGGKNLIRERISLDDGEEYDVLYCAVFEDNDKTAYDIMQEWCQAIASAK